MAQRALITGITGQDGSYLAEFLLGKGYEVYGMVRRSSTESFERIEHLAGRIQLHQADLLTSCRLNLVGKVRPQECTTWRRRASCPPVSCSRF
jgi:GDPmannose 4,6-dehydratase